MAGRVFHHPGALDYTFGPGHPLQPERLRRTLELFGRCCDEPIEIAPRANADEIAAVHDPDYIEAVIALSRLPSPTSEESLRFGFGSLDNPAFEGMWEAASSYCGASLAAAKAVLDGESVAINIGGGLHHAQRAKASGFCIFNDPALAISVLRKGFLRVAYVDIDVHHGDGVQAMFLDDPSVLTCSIHECGRTLFPGTGQPHEHGNAFTSLNVPLEAGTTGDVWTWAFRSAVMPALAQFKPEAIVLQLGADAHFGDPLAHLRVGAREWLEAVVELVRFGAPIVATGGGGYSLSTVPRMWTAAMLTLLGRSVPEQLPADLAERWGMRSFFDSKLPEPRNQGRKEAERIVAELEHTVIARLSKA